MEDDFRFHDRRLKIPSGLGKTMYRKDFDIPNRKYNELAKSQEFQPNTQKIPFLAISTYQVSSILT